MKGPGSKVRPIVPDSLWSKDRRLKEYLGSPFVKDTLASMVDSPVEVSLNRMLPRGTLGRMRGAKNEPVSLSPGLYYEDALPTQAETPIRGSELRHLLDNVLTHELGHVMDYEGSAKSLPDEIRTAYQRDWRKTWPDVSMPKGWKRESVAQVAEVAMNAIRNREKPPEGIPGVGPMMTYLRRRIHP